MAWVQIQHAQEATWDDYERVAAAMGDTPPPGLILHAAGEVGRHMEGRQHLGIEGGVRGVPRRTHRPRRQDGAWRRLRRSGPATRRVVRDQAHARRLDRRLLEPASWALPYGVRLRPAARPRAWGGCLAAACRRSAASCFKRRWTLAASSARSAGVLALGRASLRGGRGAGAMSAFLARFPSGTKSHAKGGRRRGPGVQRLQAY